MGNDAALMPFIQAANIACGYHAGTVETMRAAVALCLQHGVAVGAHPSYYDPEFFGRREQDLPEQELYELVTQQLLLLNEVALSMGATLQHVKPHGALYNTAARDPLTALTIARAVRDFDQELILYGLSGSHSIQAAAALGLETRSEAFADRSYEEDGSLTPRSQPGAVLDDPERVVAQVRQLLQEGKVMTRNGTSIPVQADTICIHGDGPHALDFARAIHQAFLQA